MPHQTIDANTFIQKSFFFLAFSSIFFLTSWLLSFLTSHPHTNHLPKRNSGRHIRCFYVFMFVVQFPYSHWLILSSTSLFYFSWSLTYRWKNVNVLTIRRLGVTIDVLSWLSTLKVNESGRFWNQLLCRESHLIGMKVNLNKSVHWSKQRTKVPSTALAMEIFQYIVLVKLWDLIRIFQNGCVKKYYEFWTWDVRIGAHLLQPHTEQLIYCSVTSC